MYDSYGITINGEDITPEKINQIESKINKTYEFYGDLREYCKKNKINICYTSAFNYSEFTNIAIENSIIVEDNNKNEESFIAGFSNFFDQKYNNNESCFYNSEN